MKGDSGVLDLLQKAIEGEFAAQHQYLLHSRLLDNWGIRALADHWMGEVKDERRHCIRFMERMVFLEAVPDVAKLGTIRVGDDITSILDSDLAAEMEAVELYTRAAKYCHSVDDFVTRDIFEATLKDEQGHVNFLETQLSLVGKLGVDLYLQHHVGKP